MRASVNFILWLLVLTTINSGPLRAEPGPVGKWLMEKPASLWDLGMLRLEEFVFGWKGAHPLANYSVRVSYDWDQNRIMIEFFVEEEFKKEKCAYIISRTRHSGGIDEDGKLSTTLNQSYYASFFSHMGYKTNEAPENYLRRLDKIFRVKVLFKNGSCEGKLLSNKVLYSK